MRPKSNRYDIGKLVEKNNSCKFANIYILKTHHIMSKLTFTLRIQNFSREYLRKFELI